MKIRLSNGYYPPILLVTCYSDLLNDSEIKNEV